MKKRLIFLAPILIILVYFSYALIMKAIFSTYVWPFSAKKQIQQETSDENKNFFMKEYPTEIVVYGDTLLDTDGLSIYPIETLNDVKQRSEESLFFKAVFLYDRSNKMELSEDDLLMIEEYLQDGWAIYYVGEKNISILDTRINHQNTEREDNASLGFYKLDDHIEVCSGFWRPSYEKYTTGFDLNALLIAMKSDIKTKDKYWKLKENR